MQVGGSRFINQSSALGAPVLALTSARIVFVQIVGQGVPSAAYSDHNVVAEDLETVNNGNNLGHLEVRDETNKQVKKATRFGMESTGLRCLYSILASFTRPVRYFQIFVV